MAKAVIFDMDGTLIDSVDLHAWAWYQAFGRFGHDVSLAAVRAQIGKGGDQLLPVFLSEAERNDHGEEMESWRGQRFRSECQPLLKPFSAVPDLLRRLRTAGIAVAVASSAKQQELTDYLKIAEIEHLVDVTTTSDDAELSKPAPGIFQSALDKLNVAASDAVAIGDSPFDAQAAHKLAMPAIGLLCGGFAEKDLRASRCVAIYQSPAALLAHMQEEPLLRA